MNARPEFTVGVPTFNRADHFLPHTLRVLLRQTFADFEILVSDNAADDDTAQVVARFDDPRIRYVRRPERIEPGAHFAAMAAEARGRFFVLNQDDDLLHLEFLRRAFSGLSAHPQATVFACPIWREQPQRGYSSHALRPIEGFCDENVVADLPYLIAGPYAAARLFDAKLPFVHPVVVMSTEHLAAIGGYEHGPGFNVDLVTQAKLLMRGPLVYDPRPGGIFRVHAGNYSRNMPRAFRKDLFRRTYEQLIGIFEQAGRNWQADLDGYLATLEFDELVEVAYQWFYYRAPINLQRLGMAALDRAWPGSRLAFHLKCASRLGVRVLCRHWASRAGI